MTIVTYRVPDVHKAQTVIGTEMVAEKDENGMAVQVQRDKSVAGSIYHRELTEFTAVVTAVKTVGKKVLHSLALIVPDSRTLFHVQDVEEGTGPGTLSFPTPAAGPQGPQGEPGPQGPQGEPAKAAPAAAAAAAVA